MGARRVAALVIVMAACSAFDGAGDRDSNEPSDAGTASSDAAAERSSRVTIGCGTGNVCEGNVCCIRDDGGALECTADGLCVGSDRPMHCDGANDCAPGNVCCIELENRFRIEGTFCKSACGEYSFEYEVCTTDPTCSAGLRCTSLDLVSGNNAPDGIRVCAK